MSIRPTIALAVALVSAVSMGMAHADGPAPENAELRPTLIVVLPSLDAGDVEMTFSAEAETNVSLGQVIRLPADPTLGGNLSRPVDESGGGSCSASDYRNDTAHITNSMAAKVHPGNPFVGEKVRVKTSYAYASSCTYQRIENHVTLIPGSKCYDDVGDNVFSDSHNGYDTWQGANFSSGDYNGYGETWTQAAGASFYSPTSSQSPYYSFNGDADVCHNF